MSDKDLSIFKSNKSNRYLNISDKKLFIDNSDIVSDKQHKRKMNKLSDDDFEKSNNDSKNEKKNEKKDKINEKNEKNRKPDLKKIRKKPKSLVKKNRI